MMYRLLVVLVLVLTVGGGVAGAVGGNTATTAQQAGNATTNATANETVNQTQEVQEYAEDSAEAVESAARAAQNATNETTGESANASKAVIGENVRVGPLVTVRSYRWTGEELILTIYAKAPTRTTVSEVVEDTSRGATTFKIRQRNLARGETTVRIPAETVTITTPGCIGEGECALLSATDGSDGSSPYSGYDSAAGWLGAGSCLASMAVAAAYRVKNRESEDIEEFE